MQIKEAIVKRIKNICLERGIKYNELATRSGVTPDGCAAAGYLYYHHQKALRRA